MVRIYRTWRGQNRVWRRPFFHHLLHRTTSLGKQGAECFSSPAVGQLGLRISKCSIVNFYRGETAP